MTRTTLVLFAAAALTAACSGSDDTSPTVETTAAAATSAVPTSTPDTTAATTTVSEAAATTTDPPPTTISDIDLAAEVEAAYLDAFDAYHAALLDPSNEALRARVRATHSGEGEDFVVQILDDLVEFDRIARAHPTLEPSAVITGPVRFENDERTEASLIACEIAPEWFYELGSGPNGEDVLLRDDVLRIDVIPLLVLTDDGWTNGGGGSVNEQVGVTTCE